MLNPFERIFGTSLLGIQTIQSANAFPIGPIGANGLVNRELIEAARHSQCGLRRQIVTHHRQLFLTEQRPIIVNASRLTDRNEALLCAAFGPTLQ